MNRLSPRNWASLPVIAEQRVRRGLVGHVLELGTGDPQPRPAPPGLGLGDAQQHRVQPRQRLVPPRADVGEHPEPLGLVGIEPGGGGRDVMSCAIDPLHGSQRGPG